MKKLLFFNPFFHTTAPTIFVYNLYVMHSLAKKTKAPNTTTKAKLPSTTAKTRALNIAGSSEHWKIGLSVGVGVFVLLTGFSTYTLIV